MIVFSGIYETLKKRRLLFKISKASMKTPLLTPPGHVVFGRKILCIGLFINGGVKLSHLAGQKCTA